MKTVLMLDQSLTCTGYTIIEFIEDKQSYSILDIGKIITKKTKNNTELERKRFILETLNSLYEKYKFKTIVLEDVFLAKNPKTTKILSELRGAIEGFFITRCEFYDLKATETRLAVVKSGKAAKEDIATFLKDEIYKDIDVVQSLGEFSDKQNKLKNSDMYDSLGIATAYKNIFFKKYKIKNRFDVRNFKVFY